ADQSLDPENSSSDAWTGIYPFPMGAALAASGVEDVAKCGYGRTLPIPRCVGCSGACGIIFSNIPLTHAYSTCQENWHLIRNRLAHSVYDYPLTAEESSVFLVVQESFARPDQVGYLVAASNSNYAADCDLQPATDFGIPVVNKAARALALRFKGDWKAQELTQKQFYMNFTTEGLDSGQWKPCQNPAQISHCFGVGTRRISLDDGLTWLAVVVLPWGAFTNGTLQQQRLIEERVRQRMDAIQAARADTWRKAALLVCAAVFFVLTAGWIISTVAVKSLDRLLDYLRKLAVLDFHGLPGLDKSIELRLSPLREVAELQLGFLNLARSVECFARFVPETVVRSILRGDRNSTTINVRKRQVTIMFSDIRGFTSISEALSQEDLLTLLYLYLSEMTKIVERRGGVVSEILGDGLLVLWNTPDDLEDHNVAACSAAIAQQKALPKLNATFASMGLPSVAIRIGIHTGDVLAGNIGSNKKMKYGCMGDPINLASRLEGLAKHYGVGTLCSDATRTTLPNTFLCRKLDLVKVKGKEEAVWVYELIDEVSGPADLHPQSRYLQLYHDALEAFHRRDFVKAIHLANSYLAQEPEDLASQHLLERAE
ncbi:cya1, partial [Symbiodinium microadriaticum]